MIFKRKFKSRINELNIKMINLQIKILIKLYQQFKKKLILIIIKKK